MNHFLGGDDPSGEPPSVATCSSESPRVRMRRRTPPTRPACGRDDSVMVTVMGYSRLRYEPPEPRVRRRLSLATLPAQVLPAPETPIFRVSIAQAPTLRRFRSLWWAVRLSDSRLVYCISLYTISVLGFDRFREIRRAVERGRFASMSLRGPDAGNSAPTRYASTRSIRPGPSLAGLFTRVETGYAVSSSSG